VDERVSARVEGEEEEFAEALEEAET